MTATVQTYIDSLRGDTERDDLRVTKEGRVLGRFVRCEIESAFQPIARLEREGGGRMTAVQALARVHADNGGTALSPWNMFTLAANDDDLVLLDRRCRVVHTLNFFAADPSGIDLLLNVHERLLAAVATEHGRAYRRVLDGLSIPPSRVVIVLPTLSAASLDLQCQVLASYRLNGFRVAVCVKEPQLLQQLTARIPADIVRIDAAQLVVPGWRAAIDSARSHGAEAHVTSVETEQGRQDALAANATHWQGWLLARPASRVPAT
jgi:EAL domain-containing protein (putative c-di-GMP-specific phosphodiesterase class I)